MKSDFRRLRIFQMKMADGEMVDDHAADVWQGPDGYLHTTGIWDDLVPYDPEEVKVQAKELGISSLEWMCRRLQRCSIVRIEMA